MVRILSPQIDNSKLNAKLALRRYFLGKYHADKPPRVIDACCGDGVVWRTLRAGTGAGTGAEGLELASYLGIDAKRKRGRLAMDSIRFLEQPGWPADILDIDVYGSPWKHYAAALPNARGPLTVFLTIGQLRLPGTDATILQAIGLGALKPPPSILGRLHDFALTYCLTKCYDHGMILIEAAEAPRSANARYIGLRLEPHKDHNH